MIHYLLNTGDSVTVSRDELDDEKLDFASKHLKPVEVSYLDGRCWLKIKPHAAGILDIVLHGRKNGSLHLLGIATVATTEEAADIAWPDVESLYLNISDQPLFRTKGYAVPRKPESTPWCASIVAFGIPEVEHEIPFELLKYHFAQAWYDHYVISGETELQNWQMSSVVSSVWRMPAKRSQKRPYFPVVSSLAGNWFGSSMDQKR